MFNYQRLKKKYEKLYNETLEKNKEILIESFVEYYGEKHRDEIVSRFNEIVFVYYIDWRDFSKVLKRFSFKDENVGKFNDLKKFVKFKKSTSDAFKANFVGSSNKKILKDELLSDYTTKDLLVEIFNDGNSEYCGILEKNKIYRLICLPILTYPETAIIHEINHSLTSYPVATVSNQTKKETIEKTGVFVNDEEINLNELINEKASLEIFGIFKHHGGDLSMIYLDVSICDYTKNLYLIDEFYNKFKEIIKESYITLNKNNLVQRIGKDNYQ